MCGIAAVLGVENPERPMGQLLSSLRHRGPDSSGQCTLSERDSAMLGHTRLRILDLSDRGAQPMQIGGGRYTISYNGEVYNYRELRRELHDFEFASDCDTEVVVAAYARWGRACLGKLFGMFAFALWDAEKRELFCARDRFGVKPLYYHQTADGGLLVASEIRALHQAGVCKAPDRTAWAGYLTRGTYASPEGTFWEGVAQLPAGHAMSWKAGRLEQWRWYDLVDRVGPDYDRRDVSEVSEEYLSLLEDSVSLRFRADVQVGINLSGGLDSALLLSLVQRVHGPESRVSAFTFTTGDPAYDETPWVSRMLRHTEHPSVVSQLTPADVPRLAAEVQSAQSEPFGGLPTLAYARLFEHARDRDVLVLLDGQGMDEQWAGYDYYSRALPTSSCVAIQGTRSSPLKPECVSAELSALVRDTPFAPRFPDELRNLQLRDITETKLPRALRFNDRISMRVATELREPFLDHRLVELALRQPPERKLDAAGGKVLLRSIAQTLVPRELREAPKRPVQTPQREWLRGPLRSWAEECIHDALSGSFAQGWLRQEPVLRRWQEFVEGAGDNGFFAWQWITIGLLEREGA